MRTNTYAWLEANDQMGRSESCPEHVHLGSLTVIVDSPAQAEQICALFAQAAAAMRAAAEAEGVAA
jgi:hypothetical protein